MRQWPTPAAGPLLCGARRLARPRTAGPLLRPCRRPLPGRRGPRVGEDGAARTEPIGAGLDKTGRRLGRVVTGRKRAEHTSRRTGFHGHERIRWEPHVNQFVRACLEPEEDRRVTARLARIQVDDRKLMELFAETAQRPNGYDTQQGGTDSHDRKGAPRMSARATPSQEPPCARRRREEVEQGKRAGHDEIKPGRRRERNTAYDVSEQRSGHGRGVWVE